VALFAATGLALYVGHHVGDYWVQTEAETRHKGDAGWTGRLTCAAHVSTYVLTQGVCLALVWLVLDLPGGGWRRSVVALAVSGVTHYAADRREHGLMFWLARRLPSTRDFLTLGKPRSMITFASDGAGWGSRRVTLDQPTLGTGAWALDQSWHLFFGVFVPALILAS
jgi:hypothetical protein